MEHKQPKPLAKGGSKPQAVAGGKASGKHNRLLVPLTRSPWHPQSPLGDGQLDRAAGQRRPAGALSALIKHFTHLWGLN